MQIGTSLLTIVFKLPRTLTGPSALSSNCFSGLPDSLCSIVPTCIDVLTASTYLAQVCVCVCVRVRNTSSSVVMLKECNCTQVT